MEKKDFYYFGDVASIPTGVFIFLKASSTHLIKTENEPFFVNKKCPNAKLFLSTLWSEIKV